MLNLEHCVIETSLIGAIFLETNMHISRIEDYYRKIYESVGVPYPGDRPEYGGNRIDYRRIEEANCSTGNLRAGRFKFLEDIPGEIRNHIYRYAFLSDEAVNGVDTKFSAIGLLMASKKAHEEASSILYGENAFTFGMEIDWINKPEIQLCGFPPIGIWPAKTYHRYLKKLHVKILLRAGDHGHLDAPEIYSMQLRAFREAYDSIWSDLDITYQFVQLPILTFTSAWIKLQLFDPLAHPCCKIQLSPDSYNPELTAWILATILHNTNVRTALSPSQRHAFNDCCTVVEDIYSHKWRMVQEDLVERITHGDHAFSGPRLPPLSYKGLILGGPDPEIEKAASSNQAPTAIPFGPTTNIATTFPGFPLAISGLHFLLHPANFSATAPSLHNAASPATKANHLRAIRRNWMDTSKLQRTISKKLSFQGSFKVVKFLMRDNELRVCASFAFPSLAKEILIERDWGLKMMVMMLECEERIDAMRESIALESGKVGEK